MNQKIAYLILGIVVIIAVVALVFALQKPNITQKAPEEPIISQKIQEPTITEPSIKIISPNGGEEWIIGNTYDVIWEAVGISSVDIALVDYRAPEKCLLNKEPISATTDKYRFKLISCTAYPGMGYFEEIQVSPGNEYKVQVYDKEETKVKDDSNDYFSIIEK